jgi:uncharacterized protein (DUF427 family)
MRTEPGAKRIRTYLGGELVADTVRPLLVWEVPYYPTYYLPVDDVKRPELGEVKELDDQPGKYVRFDWDAVDSWFEEDEEVYVHPRDPHTRVDILPTSRAVRVERDGVVLADSTHASILFETGLPPRWYIPKVDVRMDLLEHTDTATHCPYKGQAEYWAARVGDRVVKDLAWSYRTPLPESERVAGLICFFNERVDLFVDGELQERPKTKFS